MIDPKDLVQELQTLRDDGHLSDALLRYAVRQIGASDDRFDWVGVYLLKPEENVLWLHNYLGTPTEHATIPVGEGVCGMAVSEGKNQNVPDVKAAEHYLACSPYVKSEMVVLIRAGDDIFGQIDLDSETKAAFTDEDEAALSIVAEKLAEQLAAERR